MKQYDIMSADRRMRMRSELVIEQIFFIGDCELPAAFDNNCMDLDSSESS